MYVHQQVQDKDEHETDKNKDPDQTGSEESSADSLSARDTLNQVPPHP